MNCEQCGSEFEWQSKRKDRAQRFCSHPCWLAFQSKLTIIRQCEQCGEVFKARKCRVDAGNDKYCSMDCHRAAKQNNRVCEGCECEYVGRNGQKFCSRKCRDDDKRLGTEADRKQRYRDSHLVIAIGGHYYETVPVTPEQRERILEFKASQREAYREEFAA